MLQKWDGSQLEVRTGEEVLDFLENKVGMKPPIRFEDCTEKDAAGNMIGHIVPRTNWVPEPRKQRRSMKEISESIRKNNRRSK